jgi:predicted nucleic acid-binding protein
MICCDTNYLIRGLIPETHEAKSLIAWYRKGEKLITSSIVWYEFLCGPISKLQAQTINAFLTGGVIPFEEVQAIEASRLFNVTNRLRRLRVDAMIAATAITQKAMLATSNHEDFQLFVPYGLKLI